MWEIRKKIRAGSDRSIPFHLHSHIILTNLEIQSNSTRVPLVLQSPWHNAMRNEGKSNHMDEGWKLEKEGKSKWRADTRAKRPGGGITTTTIHGTLHNKVLPACQSLSSSFHRYTTSRIIRYRGYDESQWPNCSVIHLAVLSSSRFPTPSLYCIVPVKYCYTSSTVP